MYQRSITRITRSAIIIAIDSSLSMQDWTIFHNTRMRKMDAAALISNFAIDELVMRSTRAGNIRDYYDIAVIGYSGDGIEHIVGNEEGGMVHINSLHGNMPQPVCYNLIHEEEDGSLCTIPITLNEWVTPKAYGTAPMYEALVHIKDLVTKWCEDNMNKASFPPIVINISDGCCGDAEEDEILDIASSIESIGTKDGSTLLVNVYLANEADDTTNALFPNVSELFSHDQDCQMLYNMSSTLPVELEHLVDEIVGCRGSGPYKCFARNASICEILTLTDIGTEGAYTINDR